MIRGRPEVLKLAALEMEVFWDVKPGKKLLTFRRIGAPSSPETKSWPLFDPEDYLLIGPHGVISH